MMDKGRTYTSEELTRLTGLCEGTLRKNLQALRSNGAVEFVVVDPSRRSEYGMDRHSRTRTLYRLRD